MQYTQVEFFLEDKNTAEAGEILMALLGDLPFESFDDTDKGIRGFIPNNLFDKKNLTEILDALPEEFRFKYEIANIPDQNWNKKWESNYSPVLIDERCHIRAPFHESLPDVDFEILIEPKMSFGTAHHETTSMMISFVLENEWKGKTVLDMGCGTGVLAILASMMGAKKLVAIDNDEWAYKNTVENLQRNNTQNIIAGEGGKELIGDQKFDIILANINRNILLDQISTYAKALNENGLLFMSGFYEIDISIIAEEASKYQLKLSKQKAKNKWVSIMMEKTA